VDPSLNRDKECHAIPFDISSRKLRGGLSGKAFPYFFISGLLFVIVESLSRAWLFFDSWTVAPRLLCPWDSSGKNWSGLPFPPPGNLPNPGTDLGLLKLLYVP